MIRRQLGGASCVSFSGMRFVLVFVYVLFGFCHAAPLEDLVETLPDLGRPPSTQFSGYLDATDGCNTEVNGAYCKLHYWLALAETEDPWNAPVVLWLNGGPGSSSLLGYLQENGPLLLNATGGLMVNPWSWTKVANLVALEAPVGVGFSYCAVQKEQADGLCENTDKYTASASRAAMVDFFGKKFPELAGNDFFITGESYAGVYIPTLAKEILDHAAFPDVVRLVGVAVGDPCTDNKAQAHSMDALWYGHKYGLVDDAVYDLLWNTCLFRQPNLMAQGGKHWVAANLNQHLKRVQRTEGYTDAELRNYARRLHEHKTVDPGPSFKPTPDCVLAYRKFIWSTSRGLSQGWKDLYIDDYSLFAPISSQEDIDMANYLTRLDVRKALHVEEAPVDVWPYPDAGFDYTKEYDACNNYHEPDAPSMIDFYRDIVPRLEIAFVFNGDTDPCVSYEGTRTAVARVGFAELDGGSYRPWFYNQTSAPLELLAEKAPLFGPGLLVQEMGAQFGGEIVNYEHNLAFLTVHGSGHMVPQFRPQAALHMLTKLLAKDALLSPLMPTNDTLKSMDKFDFRTTMDAWTETAQQGPYVT